MSSYPSRNSKLRRAASRLRKRLVGLPNPGKLPPLLNEAIRREIGLYDPLETESETRDFHLTFRRAYPDIDAFHELDQLGAFYYPLRINDRLELEALPPGHPLPWHEATVSSDGTSLAELPLLMRQALEDAYARDSGRFYERVAFWQKFGKEYPEITDHELRALHKRYDAKSLGITPLEGTPDPIELPALVQILFLLPHPHGISGEKWDVHLAFFEAIEAKYPGILNDFSIRQRLEARYYPDWHKGPKLPDLPGAIDLHVAISRRLNVAAKPEWIADYEAYFWRKFRRDHPDVDDDKLIELGKRYFPDRAAKPKIKHPSPSTLPPMVQDAIERFLGIRNARDQFTADNDFWPLFWDRYEEYDIAEIERLATIYYPNPASSAAAREFSYPVRPPKNEGQPVPTERQIAAAPERKSWLGEWLRVLMDE